MSVSTPTALGLPFDATSAGHPTDGLLGVALALLLLLGGVLLAFLLRSALRPRAPEGPTLAPRQALQRTVLLALATVGLMDGVLVLGGLREADATFWSPELLETRADVVRLQVLARRWAWEFRLAGSDGRFGTADDVVSLHTVALPVGRPVLAEVTSIDVVHGFGLPHFRTQVDAVPGRIARIAFEPGQPGTFEVACHQHCGLQHFQMRGELELMEPAAFEAWLAERSRRAVIAFDAQDPSAQWGWPWGRP